jgi:multiple sugar transport system substrate-binding protein
MSDSIEPTTGPTTRPTTEETESGFLTRRTVLGGSAALMAAGVLAACGSDKKAADTTAAAAAAETTAAGAAPETTAAAAAPETTAAAAPETTAAAAAPETTAAGAAAGGAVSLGSNYSDAVPKGALADALAASGVDVKINTVDHNTFQEQINTYLQGKPDDVFAWFAGYRMRFFAAKGLAGDVSDVWGKLPAGELADSFKGAATGDDGKQYFVPFYLYPWAVFYRKSVWAEKGYTVPTKWDEFKALCEKMKADGTVPIAFGAKDAWTPMGTFDYINMRVNGYDFHISLMAGKESWEDPKVKKVFETWAEILPYHQEGALGRTWQEAAQSVRKKEAGMYLLGMFVGQQFQDDGKVGPDYEDLDFFAFPEIDPANGQDSVEAPIDGFMMSAKPSNADGAKALLAYIASAKAQETYLAKDPNNVAANSKASTANYNGLQKKAVELIGAAKHISQFLDRDTRPDFASTVMQPAFQTFIKDPKGIDALLKSIEAQKKTIFVE